MSGKEIGARRLMELLRDAESDKFKIAVLSYALGLEAASHEEEKQPA